MALPIAATFPVDDVKLQGEPYPLTDLASALACRGGTHLLHSVGPAQVVERSAGIHPLVAAVHLAFAQHRPLVLSPDAVWLTIAQGFGMHVRLHAEELRERFVSHTGKLSLEIAHRSDTVEGGAWAELVAGFTGRIREHVGPGLHRLLVNDFSTTGPSERTASEIAMMETFSPYFDYIVRCICGIPSVTLLGTVEDWKTIRRRVDVLAEYGLEPWAARLAPVCDKLVFSAMGRPDRQFWKCIYKPEETYGAELVTGWLTRLFPYLKEGQPNPALKTVDPRSPWYHAGLSPDSFPLGLSVAPVTLTHDNGALPERIDLLGGLVGVVQDPATLALEPVLGWSVRADRMGTAIDRVVAGAVETPGPVDEAEGRCDSIPADYLRLAQTLGTRRTLFGGAWTLRPRGAITDIRPAKEGEYYSVDRFADLPDGRWLGWYLSHRDNFQIVLGRGERVDAAQTAVIADSLVEFLEKSIGNGRFFDAENGTTGRTLQEVYREHVNWTPPRPPRKWWKFYLW